jgi:DNA mismatch repair ATPase MutL
MALFAVLAPLYGSAAAIYINWCTRSCAAAVPTAFDDSARVRDMLASRACRSSIMIGSALTKQQQAKILSRLAELDAPWNCPHGRPTMRHLTVLPGAGQQRATPLT